MNTRVRLLHQSSSTWIRAAGHRSFNACSVRCPKHKCPRKTSPEWHKMNSAVDAEKSADANQYTCKIRLSCMLKPACCRQASTLVRCSLSILEYQRSNYIMSTSTTRPLLPTRTAKDLMKFMRLSDKDLYREIRNSGLLEDNSVYAARELKHGSMTFVAFRNGVEEIRIFADLEWLNDLDMSRVRGELSWGQS